MTDFLTVDNDHLEYKWWGEPRADGKAIVMLHEGLGCIALWRDVPDLLAKATGLPVFAYTRAGYGPSSPISLPRPHDYLGHESFHVLPRVLDAAGITEADLVGHSDGGTIALMAAASPGIQDRVSSIVSLAAHVFVEDVTLAGLEDARRAYEETNLRDRLTRYHGDNVDCAFYGWNDTWLDPAFRDWNIEHLLHMVTAPSLIIQGEDDEYATPAQVEAIAAGLSGPVETWMVPGAGHMPHLDTKSDVLDRMAKFITLDRALCSA